MNNCLTVSNINKRYPGFHLKDISFTLEKGYILGLIGRNGAGKTTLIECLIGMRKADAGRILIQDMNINTHRILAMQQVGFITEPAPFFETKSLENNAILFGEFYPNWNLSLFNHYCSKYKLQGYQKYGDLSRGMKVRFQLAFALAHQPQVLIMDEPTGGLDPVFRKEFLGDIQAEVRDRYMSAVISTHLTSDLDKVADFIIMLDEGSMVLNMTKEDMFDAYPLISGRLEDLSKIPNTMYKRIRKTQDTFTTILKDTKFLPEHPEIRKCFQIERTKIENIMFYLNDPVFESEVHRNESK